MKADEVIARIETDKVTVDILAAVDGVVTKYHCEEGDTVPVGAPFVDIDPEATASATPAAAEAPKKDASPEPAKVRSKFNIITSITFRLLNPHLRRPLPPPPPLHQRPRPQHPPRPKYPPALPT